VLTRLLAQKMANNGGRYSQTVHTLKTLNAFGQWTTHGPMKVNNKLMQVQLKFKAKCKAS